MQTFSRAFSALIHLFYPNNCEGCGMALVNTSNCLCARCLNNLPVTGFFGQPGNPVERSFYGRCAVEQAGACFYFTKHSLMQHLLFELKYRGNRQAGLFLGRMTARAICAAGAMQSVDCLVPLPLNDKKTFQRGYNQAAVIAYGMAEVWPVPVITDVVTRSRFTETQTKQNRTARWQNMQQVFEVTDPSPITNRHILLVDDVITTGATLEACGACLLAVPGTRLSLAAAAYTV